MVRITEDLVRKRAEHNNLEISTLEEISLHQQDIEKIENLDKWCRDLKILYLQSNLIPKIENVGRLKKLEYLNLALNNVERIENLENCEMLQKLDLTVNFVGELTSIECLKNLAHFRELYLTGNPCTEYEGYREYVIATLPHLKYLDGKIIEKSERIKSMQDVGVLKGYIIEQQNRYRKKREKEKEEIRRHEEMNEKSKKGTDWYTDINADQKDSQDAVEDTKSEPRELNTEDEEDEEMLAEKDKKFWEEEVPFTPESRVAVHEHMKKLKQKEEDKNKPPPKQPRRLFADDGRPLNVNEAKIDFTLTEDESENCFLLDVACFKHMDTSLIDCDVQPNYVRVSLKGKMFQLCLTEEVNADSSTAKRSQITGHLLVTMPKAKPVIKPAKPKAENSSENKENRQRGNRNTHEKLEVDASAHKTVDIANIVKEKMDKVVPPLGHKSRQKAQERPNSESFVDDPDVPPLE